MSYDNPYSESYSAPCKYRSDLPGKLLRSINRSGNGLPFLWIGIITIIATAVSNP